MKDHRRLLIPYSLYDLPGTEAWLEEKARQGWMLEEEGIFAGTAGFIKSEPAEVRFRIQLPLKNEEEYPSAEAQELSEHFGWFYRASRGKFHIYCCSDPEAREMETDAQLQLTIVKKLRRREGGFLLFSLMIVILNLIRIDGGNGFRFAAEAGFFPAFMSLLIIPALICFGLMDLKALRRTEEALKRENAEECGVESAPKWKYPVFQAVKLLILAVWLISLIGSMFALTGRKKVPLESGSSFPFATGKDLCEGIYTLYPLFSYTQAWSNGALEEGIFVLEGSDILRPDKGKLNVSLVINYYRTRQEWLAKGLARTLLTDRGLLNQPGKYKLIKEELPDLGVEEASAGIQEYYGKEIVVLRKGKTVIRAELWQANSDPEAKLSLEEFARVLAESIK